MWPQSTSAVNQYKALQTSSQAAYLVLQLHVMPWTTNYVHSADLDCERLRGALSRGTLLLESLHTLHTMMGMLSVGAFYHNSKALALEFYPTLRMILPIVSMSYSNDHFCGVQVLVTCLSVPMASLEAIKAVPANWGCIRYDGEEVPHLISQLQWWRLVESLPQNSSTMVDKPLLYYIYIHEWQYSAVSYWTLMTVAILSQSGTSCLQWKDTLISGVQLEKVA